MATDIIARGMITEYKSGTNIDFKENEDGSVTISASGDVSSEDTVARETIDNHKLDKNNPHNVTAEQVGLGNVNNTADLDKPISTAVQTALNDKANTKHTHKKSDITDFPNSLPANGGNADTVDGFGVAEYVTTLPEGEYYTEAARINTRDKKIESCDTSNLKVGLADYATNADYAMNAGTVNNHTVDSDVPANAVFTDTTNSDVTIVGNPVQIDGLQGGVPFSEIAVSGKNLIGIAQAKVLGGNENSGYNVIDSPYSRTIIQKLHPNTTYTVKRYDSGNRFRIVLFNNEPSTAADITAKQLVINSDGSITEYTFTTDTANLWFAFTTHYAASGDAVEPIVQLEYGSTATAYTPPITGRELQVNVSGKNLLKYPYSQTTRTSYGVTFTDNGDGSITASGTHDGGTNVSYFGFSPWWANTNGGRLFLPKGNTITFRVMGLPNKYQCQLVVKKDNTSTDTITVVYGIGESAANYTAEQDCYIACGIIGLPSSVGQAVNFTAYPQLEIGNAATEYEPYHGTEYTITPDTNPYTIPDDIRQQDGLNVVSVLEGELSVTGVRKNAAVKKIWDKIDELTTAIIVSNGE